MTLYKQKMDGIHAPEALVQDTIKRMHKENYKFSNEAEHEEISRKREKTTGTIRAFKIVSLAACVCLAIVGGLLYSMVRIDIPVISNCVDSETYTGGFKVQYSESDIVVTDISLQDYCERIECELPNSICGFASTDSKCKLITTREGSILDCVGVFNYNKGSRCFTVTMSQSQILAPLALLSVEPTIVGEVSVRLARSSENGRVYAFWSGKNGNVCAKSVNMTDNQFAIIIKELVKTI